jgi:hypothetical protein
MIRFARRAITVLVRARAERRPLVLLHRHTWDKIVGLKNYVFARPQGQQYDLLIRGVLDLQLVATAHASR